MFGAIARTGGTCGMHVHVGIDSDEEGVRVIDRLVAAAAGDPRDQRQLAVLRGADTGYASWRSQVWNRWPSAGPTQAFGSVEAYRRGLGAARELGCRPRPGDALLRRPAGGRAPDRRDPGAGRLHRPGHQPADRGAGPRARRDRRDHRRRPGLLAGRDGPRPRSGAPRDTASPPLCTPERTPSPAREVVQTLVDTVRPALEEAGDLGFVTEQVESVLRSGGAVRQRAAYERTGRCRRRRRRPCCGGMRNWQP